MSYVSLLEAGRRQPTRKIAEALAAKLGVDPDYLLSGHSTAARHERQLQRQLAELALINGDAKEARRTLERLREGVSDDDEQFALDHDLARAHERSGDIEQAIEVLEALRQAAERDPTRRPWLQVVIDLSRCYREAGDLAHAVEVADTAAARARSLGLDAGRDFPRLVVTLAGAYRERGDLAHAALLLRQLLIGMDERTTRRDRGSALWNAAVVAAERGEFAEAVLLSQRALAQFAEEDDVRADGLLRTNLAWILLDSDGDAEEAMSLLLDARSRLLAAGMQIEAAYTETELARASVALGQAAAGIQWARGALERLGQADRLESARARLALARALLAEGETAAAIAEMTGAAQVLEEQTAGRQAAAVWRDLAELHLAVGDGNAAQACFTKALALLGLPGAPTRSRLARSESATPTTSQPAT